MEAAKIDWKSLESVFVVDHVYENINAPQWMDLLAPDLHLPPEDSWFCRPDCKHPKTAEDFLKSTPPSKFLRSVGVSKLTGLGDWTWRSHKETNLKRRGMGQASASSDHEDSENQNPNCSPHQIKSCKEAIKSSAEKARFKEERAEEKDEHHDSLPSEEEKRKLKSTHTLSARDLLGGKDIFGKITEFCNELKKMASRAGEGEEGHDQPTHSSPNPTTKVVGVKGQGLQSRPVLGELVGKIMTESQRDKERTPLLQITKERYQVPEKCTPKQKPRKMKRADEAENVPAPLEWKDMKHKEEERLLPIRTNPPTPQGFSATRDPAKTTPSKGPKSRLVEALGEKSRARNASLVDGKEGRGLDVFWFLKPCTL